MELEDKFFENMEKFAVLVESIEFKEKPNYTKLRNYIQRARDVIL